MKWLRQRSLVSVVLFATVAFLAGCGNTSSKTDAVKVGTQVTLPPLPFDAGDAPLITVADNDFYVIQRRYSNMMSRAPLRAAFYDSTKKLWKELPPLPERPFEVSTRWAGKKLRVIGFVCSDPIDSVGSTSTCSRSVPTLMSYDPQQDKWLSTSLMPALFPGEQDIAVGDVDYINFFGVYKNRIYLSVLSHDIILDGESFVARFPEISELFSGIYCQVGSILVNLGIPEDIYDVDSFLNDTSPDGRLPRFGQLVMETVDLADESLPIEKVSMPDPKLLNLEIRDLGNTRIQAVCTSTKVLLIAPNIGPLFSWDSDTKVWSAASRPTSAASTSTSFPLYDLGNAAPEGEVLIVGSDRPNGGYVRTLFDPKTNQYREISLPLKEVDGKKPLTPTALKIYKGAFLIYQDFPGRPAGEFIIFPFL